MPAPKGNQFWKLRSRHGVEKLFKTPDLLWEAACEYFEWCDKHPWKKVEAIKSGELAGKMIKVPTQRPYTITGFLIYIGTRENFWRNFKAKKHEDFEAVIAQIELIIYNQKFEGAAVGAFNANIISRDLGLKDQTDITSNGKELQQLTQNIDVILDI